MSMSILMWYVGGTLAMPLAATFPPRTSEILASIRYPKITQLILVPLTLEELVPYLRQNNNNGFHVMSRLKFVAFGGAACPIDICNELIQHGVKLISFYGSTEMGYVCINDCDSTKNYQLPRLRPLRRRNPAIQFVPIEAKSNICDLVFNATDLFIAPDYIVNGIHSPGDLFLEDPPGSGYYIVQGRKDDILVHKTGEKTNPLPIELTIREHPIVKHAAVIGHGRLCCSVLVELNNEEASRYEQDSIEERIWDAVKNANKGSPSHSYITPSLVKILPPNEHLPITGKGNIIRKSVDAQYGTMIDTMYENFFNNSKAPKLEQCDDEKQVWTKSTLCSHLQKILAKIMNKPIETFSDYSQSLFKLSLNSVTAVELRHMLCLEFGSLKQNIIYEFPTIDCLADELLRIIHNENIESIDDFDHYEETEVIIDKYINLLRTHKNDFQSNQTCLSKEERTVLVTGANGSLGSHLILQLSKKPQVTRIYCLLRGGDASNRLREAMKARKQDSSILSDTKRIVILSANLNDDKLGQSERIYNQLQSEVTDIIHSGWTMDFNMNIHDFDRECLLGLYHLLILASSSKTLTTMRFHFVSSISAAGSGKVNEIQEESLPRHMKIALPHGYGQSKYAGEHICLAATNLLGIPVDIYRCGQISGDSKTGVWNTAEMIPLLLCTGSGQLGVLPSKFLRIDWIPVNYAAAAIADIVIDQSKQFPYNDERVHHIMNPQTMSWSNLLQQLKTLGFQSKIVSMDEWLRILLKNPTNPAYVLAGFFEKIFSTNKAFQFPKFHTNKTIRRTTNIEGCPPIDHDLLDLYLNYWQRIGFLKTHQ